MNNHPSGTVTFLFTEFENSANLSQDFPERLESQFEKINEIILNAIESNNGFAFKKISDEACCCAFEKASDAVNAAVSAHLDLKSVNNSEAIVKVRTGIHTGPAKWGGNDYNGYLTLATVHRIMSSAYGAQILISESTVTKATEQNPDIAEFRDLGMRKLKDIKGPVRIFQIISEGLKRNFPPIKTLDERPNNLPVQLTTFIGREKELTEIKNLLKKSKLLTLIGPGGTGKTRLSIQTGFEVADEFENGVRIAELASICDPPQILNEIADALNIKASGGADFISAITDYLKEKQLLLILDNCEHLIIECAKISNTLLNSCQGLKIIVSSRESLKITGEIIFHVPALSLPGKKDIISADTLSQYEAVRLFIDRAQSVNPDFSVTNENANALAELCHQLDGIPLAIELAASRIIFFNVAKILDNISNRFKLLTGGSRTALPRQKTLRAMIDWSYDLLLEKEKLLFASLSVFTGGWSMEAAEEVCSGDGIDESEVLDLISNLFDKSLLISKDTDGFTRFNMLESIRQYSLEKLNSDSRVYEKHFKYFYKLSCKYDGDAEYGLKEKWKKEIDLDEDNLRSALKWGIKNNQTDTAEFAINISEYYEIKGYYNESYSILKKLIETDTEMDGNHRAIAFLNLGFLASQHDENETAEKYARMGLEYFVATGNKVKTADALSILGIVNFIEGNIEEAIKLTKESLIMLDGLDEKLLEANVKSNLAAFTTGYKETAETIKLLDDALGVYKSLGQTDMSAKILISKGGKYYQDGDYVNAEIFFNEGLSELKVINDEYTIATTLYNLGNLNFVLNKYSEAEKFYEESMIKSKEFGFTSTYDRTYIKLGEIALIKNEKQKAKEIFITCLKSFNKSSEKLKLILSIYGLGNYYFLENNYELSAKLFFIAEKINGEVKFKLSKWRIEENDRIISVLKKEISEDRYSFLTDEIRVLNLDNATESALKLIQ